MPVVAIAVSLASFERYISSVFECVAARGPSHARSFENVARSFVLLFRLTSDAPSVCVVTSRLAKPT